MASRPSNVVDLFAATAERRAEAAVDLASDAAMSLIAGMDRFRLLMPDADSALVMSIEATALLAANVGLTAGRAIGAAGGDEAAALARLRLTLDQLRGSLDAYQAEVETRLSALFQDDEQ